jgi:hypothetical protein
MLAAALPVVSLLFSVMRATSGSDTPREHASLSAAVPLVTRRCMGHVATAQRSTDIPALRSLGTMPTFVLQRSYRLRQRLLIVVPTDTVKPMLHVLAIGFNE